MQAYMPMLVVRTRQATAVVEMNGTLVGEASPGAHLALPLSDSGEYYIGIYPIEQRAHRFFPVVRKLRFISGLLQPVESEDVEAYAWPDGVFEAVFTPGILPAIMEASFPFTVDQIKLPGDRYATLYHDGGLKLAIEEGMRVIYGAALGDMRTGRLISTEDGRIIALAGEPGLQEEEAPEGYADTALVLDAEFRELIRIRGDAAGVRGEDEIICFHRLGTMRRHDKKQVFRYTGGAYEPEAPEVGFFTHSPKPPETGGEVIRCFCEAVLYGLWGEALTYLSPSLRDGLDEQHIRECLGPFTGVRAPLTRRDRAIGLLYPCQDGIVPVRVFTFEFEDGLIDNLSED